MVWQIGNRFWEVRSSHGRKPIFATPDDLWDAACQYFEWNEANPIIEEKLFAYQGEVTKSNVNRIRAMTIMGLCLFLDISEHTWGEYKQRDGFSQVTSKIDSIIRKQKFEGAAADQLNANIIARDLGLKEHGENKNTNTNELGQSFFDLVDRLKGGVQPVDE